MALTGAPLLQVAFFLPQLVQLLRGDSNGMIQHFLFTAAARSNVFAYNLVCILKVSGMYQFAMKPAVTEAGSACTSIQDAFRSVKTAARVVCAELCCLG